ncbi:hypothetical protein CDEST_08225 [Colletotrichum destructivum]|uniref:Uncharacterized protein n=1 Tax=Colletotrichum destructivum TaxID=34406 RepID=A0AAX4III7_9PEZI|nr:hypothetical protein CDEST_08225 [Colletotrichum destructivum]
MLTEATASVSQSPVSSTMTLDVGCATTWQQGGTASRRGVQRVQWAESDRSSHFLGAASAAGLFRVCVSAISR